MTALFGNRALADAAAGKLKVFAQPQRLMILSLLLEGERTVGEIDAATGVGQPALSQQLAALRRTKLVLARKEAKNVYYALADDGVALCVRTLEAIMCDAGDLAQRLSEILSSDTRVPQAQSAPAGSAVFARIE
ncbi:MAG: ArsR/SmtB family transcription factor [Rhodoblastus sp.]